MDRRLFLSLGLAALAPRKARAAAPPWRARLLVGAFHGGRHHIGLAITLEPGWKTYWRVPGEGGVPPEVTASGINLAEATVSLPLPQRFSNDDGSETIGFHDEVVFPMAVTPRDASLPIELDFRIFFGVCRGICIPADYATAITLDPAKPGPDAVALSLWQARVPEPVAAEAAPVTQAELDVSADRPALVLALARPLRDIFVEAPGTAFFHKPDFTRAAGKAWLAIADLKDVMTLRGQILRLTLDDQGRGVEQSITIP